MNHSDSTTPSYASQKRWHFPIWWLRGLAYSLSTHSLRSTENQTPGTRFLRIQAPRTATWGPWIYCWKALFETLRQNQSTNLAEHKPGYASVTYGKPPQSCEFRILDIVQQVVRVLGPSVKNSSENIQGIMANLVAELARPLGIFRLSETGYAVSEGIFSPFKEVSFSAQTNELIFMLSCQVSELTLGPFPSLNNIWCALNPDILSLSKSIQSRSSPIGTHIRLEPRKCEEQAQQHECVYLMHEYDRGLALDLIHHGRTLYDHGETHWKTRPPAAPLSLLLEHHPPALKTTAHALSRNHNPSAWLLYCQPTHIPPQMLQPQTAPNQIRSPEIEPKSQSTSTPASGVRDLPQVEAFYQSLSPTQKQSFDRQRASMTPEEFLEYIQPIIEQPRRRRSPSSPTP